MRKEIDLLLEIFPEHKEML
jgi:hypothetical protein